mgnify:CR=1 FL=1
MSSIFKPLSTALLGGLLLSGCVLDEDSDGYNVDVNVGDVVKGVAEVTVTVSGDGVAEGQDINVTPNMQMVDGDGNPTMTHGTPFSANEGQLDASGQFKTTAYFLMPSAMGDTKMGDWSINVEYNGVTENFPITVKMMGTDRKNLVGTLADDPISHMGNDVARSYYLYEHALDTEQQFSVYIAARETLFDYPAVINGAVLSAGTSYELNIGTAEVTMCLDSGSTCAALDVVTDNDGIYTTTDLTFVDKSTDKIRVSLSINSDEKTITKDNTDDNVNNPVTYNYVEFSFSDMSM